MNLQVFTFLWIDRWGLPGARRPLESFEAQILGEDLPDVEAKLSRPICMVNDIVSLLITG
jgi:hypothetical protein